MTHHPVSLFKSMQPHLLWFMPLIILGIYIHTHLAFWCDSYFGVPEIQQSVQTITLQSEHVPPTLSLFDTFGTFMVSTMANAKLYTLSSVSTLITRLGQLILDILGVILLWIFVSKTRQTRQGKTTLPVADSTTLSELQREIKSLHREIVSLNNQLNKKGRNS